MKTLTIWLAKKYALSLVRDAVAAKADTVALWATRVGKWIERIGAVAEYLRGLASKLSDGVLTEDEATAALAEANALAKLLTQEA